MSRVLGAALIVVLAATAVHAQALSGEVSITGGASTDEVSAGALQGRVFGDLRGTRVFGELAWATVAGPESDAFGARIPTRDGCR